MFLLPDIPRRSSLRAKAADGVFATLVLISRTAFAIGALVGNYFRPGVMGFGIGLLIGVATGFWISRSLGLRGRDLTRGFYVRMLELGDGRPRKWLESLVAGLRGDNFTPTQCRIVAGAYAEARRQLQSCDTAAERNRIIADLNQKVRSTLDPQAQAKPGDGSESLPRVERVPEQP